MQWISFIAGAVSILVIEAALVWFLWRALADPPEDYGWSTQGGSEQKGPGQRMAKSILDADTPEDQLVPIAKDPKFASALKELG
jgi:hypothetical protein